MDQSVTLWLNDMNHWITDDVWMFCSAKEVWIPFYIFLIYLIWIRLGWKKALVIFLAIGLTILCCDQFSNILKHSVGRLRPCYSSEMLSGSLHILEKRGGFYGFYSSHAANAFGLATASLIGFRNDKTHKYNKYAISVYLWAFMVGVSRVFVGKHYLGDVLVGIVFGIVIGISFGALANLLINRYLSKDKPGIREMV